MKTLVKVLGLIAIEGLVAGVGLVIGAKVTNEVSNMVFGKSKVGIIDVNMKDDTEDKKG